ncbi:MAG TPA: hypothetical protein DEO50_02630 [Erysipelotrichaceae bacterium]|nr:MAG: hypothetical protein A2Y19_08625 [Firmicutes bacterium GWE2_51_13]HBZ40780.1 hypothetical protein [Erysipelotrichaceae bacterium]
MFGIIALILYLNGCAAKPKPTEPVEAFLTALKADINSEFDDTLYFTEEVTTFDTFNQIEENPDTPLELQTKLTEMLKAFEYKIISETVDNDKAVVVVEVKTHDLGGLFTEWVTLIFTKAFEMAMNGATEEEIEAVFIQDFLTLAEKSEMDLLKTVEVKLTLVDGKWLMDGGDANRLLFNAVTGDFLSFAEENPIFEEGTAE